MFSFGVQAGTVDFDDVQLKMVQLTDAEKALGKTQQKPAKKAVKKAVKSAPVKNSSKYVIYSGFEKWQNQLPVGWKRYEKDKTSVIRRMILGEADAERFGSSALFLNGKVLMDPPMVDLAVPRSRPMRLAFYAKGANGKIHARLMEGRNGHIDYIVDLIEENTTSEWKKYATAFALPPACRIDNAAIELIGENVIVDNVEFKAAQGGDGKLVYSIPVVKTAPVIDGKNAPGEWDFAVGASDPLQLGNYLNATHAKPESPALSQQNTVRFCSDGKKLYFMFERCDLQLYRYAELFRSTQALL